MNTALRDELLHHLDVNSTGCLSVVARGGQLRLFLMDGEILAAESPEDDVQLLRRVVVAGLLPKSGASSLMGRSAQEEVPVSELLYEVLPEDAVADLLFDRFKENVRLWIEGDSTSEFEALDAIFRPDIHTRHDSRELLGQLEIMLARTEALRGTRGFGAQLRRGQVSPNDEAEKTLTRVVGAGRSVAQILRSSPFEELFTLNRLALMLESGVLRERGGEDEPTFIDASPEDNEASDSLELGEADTDAGHIEALDAGEDVGEGFQLAVGPPEHAGLDEEDVAAFEMEIDLFEDNDKFRNPGVDDSGEGDISFIRSGGDRVELPDTGLASEPSTPAPPEPSGGAAAVQVKYSGPTLSRGDARQKIDVANSVLRVFSTAFDELDGVGSGPSKVQLLLDGTPAEFSDLFRGIEAAKDGSITPESVMSNLKRRMPSEHRRLLNRAINDLFGRAMDVAVDSLEDDDMLDTLHEAIVANKSSLGF